MSGVASWRCRTGLVGVTMLHRMLSLGSIPEKKQKKPNGSVAGAGPFYRSRLGEKAGRIGDVRCART